MDDGVAVRITNQVRYSTNHDSWNQMTESLTQTSLNKSGNLLVHVAERGKSHFRDNWSWTSNGIISTFHLMSVELCFPLWFAYIFHCV